jgi:hypothetical protein
MFAAVVLLVFGALLAEQSRRQDRSNCSWLFPPNRDKVAMKMTARNVLGYGRSALLAIGTLAHAFYSMTLTVRPSCAFAARRSDPASGSIGGARSHHVDALAHVVANGNPRDLRSLGDRDRVGHVIHVDGALFVVGHFSILAASGVAPRTGLAAAPCRAMSWVKTLHEAYRLNDYRPPLLNTGDFIKFRSSISGPNLKYMGPPHSYSSVLRPRLCLRYGGRGK